MSNGLYIVGRVDWELGNNYVSRTGQNAVQADSSGGCLIQDNVFEHTGGGGASTIQFYGVRNTTVRRSHYRSANVAINAQPGINEAQGSCGNTFEGNAIDGKVFTLGSAACSQP